MFGAFDQWFINDIVFDEQLTVLARTIYSGINIA